MSRVSAIKEQSWFWFFLAGVGTGIGIYWPFLWWLVFPGVASFLYAVSRSPSKGSAWWGGWAAGTIKMGCSFGWVWTTYPIEWIDLGLGAVELPVIGFYWLTLAVVVGAGSAVLALVLYSTYRRIGVWWWSGVVLIGWLLSEALGALFFSVFTLGAGSTINALFSFGMVGNLVSEHSVLLQAARIGGVYALSIVAVAAGFVLFQYRDYWLSRDGVLRVALVVMLLIVTTALPIKTRESGLPGTVAIIDTTFGGTDFFALPNQAQVKTEALTAAITAAKAAGAAYIILPEGSHVTPSSLTTREAFGLFRNRFSNTKSVVIESVRVPISLDTSAMRGRIYDERLGLAYTIDKQRLVPQGEYMPTVYVTLLSAFGLRDAVTTIYETLDYRPGPYVSQAELPAPVPSVLFCFAEADPLAVRRLTAERTVPFIAHPISHAWFHSPGSLWWQYDAMRKIHAVWNQVSIITAGNMVQGAWYSPSGEIIPPRVVATGEWWAVSVVP